MRLLAILTLFTFFFSCVEKTKPPGKPLMAFNFNEEVVNEGLANAIVQGGVNVDFGIMGEDTCLDLGASAKWRKPLEINYGPGFSFDDYIGFGISFWVQKDPGDPEEYTILSQQRSGKHGLEGWEIRADKSGAWSWLVSDSLQTWTYQAGRKRQAINDGRWHQIAFSFDRQKAMARLYFDGDNVAVYAMDNQALQLDSIPIRIGINPEMAAGIDLFNGKLDELAVWPRPLTKREVEELYQMKYPKKFMSPSPGDELKVMTWDIWQGGIHEGKHVGKERILEVIRSSRADVVMLQEMGGIGPYLADGLGFCYYQRTVNLGLLSRYPIAESVKIYKPENAACVKIDLGKNRQIFACPIALSARPRMDAYLKSGQAVADTIVARETGVRGKEITFILGELNHVIAQSAAVPLILGGGFYSGSHLDWTEENKFRHMDLAIEYPVSALLARRGFKDSYRMMFPDEVNKTGYTWSPKFNSAFPDRMDFIYYIGESIVPINSYVIEDHLISFPSSHAAVITVFDMKSMKNMF